MDNLNQFDNCDIVYKNASSFWTSRANSKGHVVYLEVSPEAGQLKKSSSGQICVCGAAHNGFSTDDTGYGTDTEMDNLSRLTQKYDDPPFSTSTLSSESVQHRNSSRKSTKHKQNLKENYHLFRNGLTHEPDLVCTCSIEDNCDALDFFNMENIREINLKLNLQNSKLISVDKSRKVGHVGRALCKGLLGIVPGHFQSGAKRGKENGMRLCVRGFVRDGPASKKSNIHIGDCLRLVNGREVTWDNIDDVFTSIIDSKQVRIVLQDVSRSATVPVLVKEKVSTDEESLVRLVTGICFDDAEPTEPGEITQYSIVYLDTEKLKSEENVCDEDVLYRYPADKDHDLLQKLRGCFVTIHQLLLDISESTVKKTTIQHEGETIHVSYHTEENGLLLVMYPAKKVIPAILPPLVEDIVRVLRVQYGSVTEAFSSTDHVQELDSFFCLFHHSLGVCTLQSNTLPNHSLGLGATKCLSCFNNVQYLPLYTSFKDKIEKIVNSFEAADFFDMSDSFYGCRRSYTILGSCLFYKAKLLCNHLPKNDLCDLHLYLRYHNLLNLSSRGGMDQLVIWREVHPTRQWYDLGEEQMFGYSEPVTARWFWLIVGYKHSLLCVLLEAGGCTTKLPAMCMPDPFYIDQCRATLMQIVALGLPAHCDTSYSSPVQTMICPMRNNTLSPISPSKNTTSDFTSSLRRQTHTLTRKDSFHSDGSSTSNSSGGSIMKKETPTKMRLFQVDYSHSNEMAQDVLKSRKIKLTVGAENCLLHFLHIDKIDGVFVSPTLETNELEKDIAHNFHLCCTQIKHMFDRYRYRKKYPMRDERENDYRIPSCPDPSFYHIREEGVLFQLPQSDMDHKVPESYWVVGRQRSKTELYVCFKDGIPQNLVELAFRMGFGLQV
ncbi:Protein inturned [Mizuhopecten yessoensis]|uniref:Protein inturned n=1 Tax=Mizuhopecten yessoensis TaxID=6573 RepID=A0A210PNN7_MIZYE|nr:Protein inturned [Mizuhopecten yessoensis]